MNRTASDTQLRQLAEALAAPDIHIPAAVPAGIDSAALKRAVRLFRSAVFAGYFDAEPIAASLGELSDILARQSARACATFHRGVHPDAEPFGREVAAQLLKQLPELRRRLGTDVKAVFDGDPAAVSYEEVILCYPALVALTHYRLAHALLQLGVPILPRLISEAAHSATGIDIHPGAEIGEYFSIDHGTGVVIGETCVIGNHVRLYQGVTLGAKSFKFDAAGNILQEPRHPILEDNVVVYSNSSILGRVRIGHDTVVGGNVWQTTDLPPYSRVIQGRASVSTFENGGGI
ncbi:serine O-acetyltransferase [Alistipes timonensis JC136]|uniref:Serine O-acetyltransferase n=1 Tax=Alistipes timonensis JC136 TaxID=1033731 RepID=A0A1H3ZG89_9BACT|nr:serine acetyltransferase [Alistipes timonensis]SEA22421.1 serine O-acetyltransferase [Alistipes timonensis JC136]